MVLIFEFSVGISCIVIDDIDIVLQEAAITIGRLVRIKQEIEEMKLCLLLVFMFRNKKEQNN